MSENQASESKLTPRDEREIVSQKVPAAVSLVKVARQLGVPPRVVSKMALEQTEVPIFRVGDGVSGGLLVRVSDLDRLTELLLVRANDPKNPKGAFDEKAMKRKLREAEPSARSVLEQLHGNKRNSSK